MLFSPCSTANSLKMAAVSLAVENMVSVTVCVCVCVCILLCCSYLFILSWTGEKDFFMFFLWWNKNENSAGKALVNVCNIMLAFVQCQ